MSRDNDSLEASSANDGRFISHSQLIRCSFVTFSLTRVPEERGGSEEVDKYYKPGQEETDVITVNKKKISMM